jgi:hypothetical protein
VLITTNIVNKFESKWQGELVDQLSFIELFAVLVPATTFLAPGPSRIISLNYQRFLTRASFL